MTSIDKESAFAELVRDYEDKWIAIEDKGGVDVVVGSGNDAVEAAEAAEANGFPNAILFKVPSFNATLIP